MDEYNNAAAMYGLVLLNSDYSGNCVTVRRASDNATQNISFDGQNLDIAALESFCSGTDGFVSVWYDQSGNANNAVQTTASSQPKIVSSGSVLLQNGKPKVQFDGVDDSLELSSTILGVRTIADVIDKGGFYYSSAFGFFAHFSNYQIRIGSTSYTFSSYSNNQAISFLSYDGSDAKQRYNGGTETTNSISATLTISSIGRYFSISDDIEVQSLIVYTTNQIANRAGIETALNEYYSIY